MPNKSSLQSKAASGLKRVVLAVLLLTPAWPSYAQQIRKGGSGPFASFSGLWQGGGSITFSDGHQERVRCRATYRVQAGGDALIETLRCASDSYNFDLSAHARATGASVSGKWKEATRGLGGTLSGSIREDQMKILVQGKNFAAGLGLSTNSNQQLIQIRSRGTEFKSASINLRRGG